MGWWVAWEEYVNFNSKENEEENERKEEETVEESEGAKIEEEGGYKPGRVEGGELEGETKNDFIFLKPGLQPEVDFHAGFCLLFLFLSCSSCSQVFSFPFSSSLFCLEMSPPVVRRSDLFPLFLRLPLLIFFLFL